MIDLRPHLRPGDGVWWGQAGAEATPLVDALLDQAVDVGSLRGFCGLTLNPRLRGPQPGLTQSSFGAMGTLRGRRDLQVVPTHYSVLPRLFAERLLPVDVGLVQVAPPGPDGRCSLGIGVDYTADAIPHTRTLIGEINHRMRATSDTPGIALDRFAAVIETDRPPAVAPARAPDAVDLAIAAHVAGLVEDGDTIEVGVGTLPEAILDGFTGHRDLGYHSGLASEGVLRLVEEGVLTGRRKEIDQGLVVTGFAMGTAELYDRLVGAPVVFRPASYTHDPAVLARLRRLVAINSALAVDLTGQVGAEVAGGRYLGGIGGQADFSGAAARTGARSVIALRATAGAASTIVAELPEGTVTTARADVDAVVTEHGVAHLRGCPLPERAERLVAIAAPEHRAALRRAADERIERDR